MPEKRKKDKKARDRSNVFQKPFEFLQKFFLGHVFDLAFPKDQEFPAGFRQLSVIFTIAPDVLFDLFTPEVCIRLRPHEFRAVVSVPEAAVDENDFFQTAENDIGLSRKISGIQAVAITVMIKDLSDNDLGLRIFAFDLRHIVTPLSGRVAIRTVSSCITKKTPFPIIVFYFRIRPACLLRRDNRCL